MKSAEQKLFEVGKKQKNAEANITNERRDMLLAGKALPAKMLLDYDFGTPKTFVAKKTLEAAGVEFTEQAEADGLVKVKLPAGWRVVFNDYLKILHLTDDKGRARAYIQNDSKVPSLRLIQSHLPWYNHKKEHDEGVAVCEVHTGFPNTKIVHTTEPIKIDPTIEPAVYIEKAKNRAIVWLDREKPHWRDPGAYWDEGDKNQEAE